MKEMYQDITNGVVSTALYDEADEKWIIDTRQDCTQALEDNKRKRNETGDWRKFDSKQEYHMVLDLTMTDYMVFRNNHNIDLMADNVDWKEVFTLVETRYPYMKTTTARLV